MSKAIPVTLILCWALGGPALAVTPWQAQELTEAIASGTWQQSEKICRDLLPQAPLRRLWP